jgi:hypothetical protein
MAGGGELKLDGQMIETWRVMDLVDPLRPLECNRFDSTNHLLQYLVNWVT